MKSNGNKIKTLVILLIITLSNCGFFDRKAGEDSLEDMSFENFEKSRTKSKSKNKAKVAADNSWDNGYTFEKFEVKKAEDANYENFGQVIVNPKKMENVAKKNYPTSSKVALTNDELGFIMEIKLYEKLDNIKPYHFISPLGGIMGKRILIPWRFFKGKPYYQNPLGSSKIITANMLDDQGKEYNIKFTLPYKLIGWYISNSQSEEICKICEEMSKKQNNMINKYKSEISHDFTGMETNNNLKNTIPELEAQINERQEKLKTSELNFAKMQNNIDQLNNNLMPLKIKRKILLDRNMIYNEQNEVYSRRLDEFKANDPNMEKRATDELEKNKSLLKVQMKQLRSIAPDRKNDITSAEDAGMILNRNEMEIELRKVGPLIMQSK